MGEIINTAALQGKKVYFDTNLFIYAVEPTEINHPYLAVIEALFGMAEAGEIQVPEGIQKICLSDLTP